VVDQARIAYVTYVKRQKAALIGPEVGPRVIV